MANSGQFGNGHLKVSEVYDSRHGEIRLECGGLPPLWARRRAMAGREASGRAGKQEQAPVLPMPDFNVALPIRANNS